MRFQTFTDVVNMDCGLLGNNAVVTTYKTTWCYTAVNQLQHWF
jgi:hypothetical protein